MKLLKKIFITFITFIIFTYLLIFFSSIILFNKNKKTIEKTLAEILLFENAEIKGFVHIPFLIVRFKDITLSNNSDTYFKLKDTDIYYNIFKFSKKNPLEILYKININKVFFGSSYEFGKNYVIELFKKYSVFYIFPEQKHKININETYLYLDFLSGIKATVCLKNLDNFISHNLLSFNGQLNIDLKQLEKVILFNTTLDFNINFGLNNGKSISSLSSSFNISNFILGGLPLIENQKFGFSTTNLSNINETVVKNLFELKLENDQTLFNLKKDFLISYSKNQSSYLLEYIMPEGKYYTEINGNFLKSDFVLNLKIQNYNTDDKLKFSLTGKNKKTRGEIKILSKLIKNLYAKFSLDNGINGTAYFTIDYHKQFLEGNLGFHYKDNILKLKSNRLFFGNINLGGFESLLSFSSNGVYLRSIERSFGIIPSGEIKRGKARLNLRFNNSILNSINGVMNANLNIKTEIKPLKIEEIDGDIEIINYKTYDEIISSKFKYKDKTIYLESLSLFKLANISFVANIEKTTKGYLNKINGEMSVRKYIKLPLNGILLLNENLSINNLLIYLDKDITINLTNLTNSSYIFKVLSKNYSTEKFGLDGNLNLDLISYIGAGQINYFILNSTFTYNNHPLKLYIKSTRNEFDKEIFDIPLFSFETEDDKLFGKGFLTYGKNKRLYVYFIRGGKIDVNFKENLLSGEININKLILRNLLIKRETPRLFLNLNTIFKQKIDSDILNNLEAYGNFSISDTKEPDLFFFNVPNFYFQKGELRASYSRFKYSGVDTSFSVYGKDKIFNINGNLVAFNNISFNYFAKIFRNTDSWNANYRIYNFNLENFTQSFSGRVTLDKSYLIFYSEGSTGITGYINLKKNPDWKIDFIGADLSLSTSGNFDESNITMDIDYDIPLKLFEGFFYLKKLSGKSKGKFNFKGDLENSEINGNISFINFNGETVYSKTYISNLNSTIPISNSYLLFENKIIPTSTGNFSINGFVNIKDVFNPYISLKILPISKTGFFSLNYNNKGISLYGKIIPKEVELTASKNELFLKGEITTENLAANVPLTSFTSFDVSQINIDIFEKLKLDINLNIGNNNKLSTPLNQFIFKKNSNIRVYGGPSLENIKIKGEIAIERGDFTYFSKTFSIKEGSVSFKGDDLIPYINLLLWYRYKDVNKENVDIYLTFEGKASKIIMKDFYSVPEKPKDELSLILGISKGGEESISSRTPSVEYIKTGVGFAENVFFFTPLSLEVKRRFGLDLFSFRSTILQNYVQAGLERQTNVDFRNYISGSGIVMGKYILPNLFLEYELFLEKDSFTPYGLVPVHTIGLELDLSYFNLGWKYQPYDVGRETTYEQMLELKFIRKF